MAKTVYYSSKFKWDDGGVESCFSIGNKIYVIYAVFKSNDSSSFFAVGFDKKTLQSTNEKIELGTFKCIRFIGRHNPIFNLMYSGDSSTIAFQNIQPQQNNFSKHTYILFNSRMERIWDKVIDFKKDDKLVDIFSVSVLNKTDLAFLLRYKKDNGNADSTVHLLVYENQKKEPKDLSFNINKRIVTNLNIVQQNNSNLSLFGICYNEQSNIRNCFFYGNLNIETGQTNVNIDTIPQKIIQKIGTMHSSIYQEKYTNISLNFKFKGVFQMSNGSKNYVLEYYNKYVTGGTRSTLGSPNLIEVVHQTVNEYGEVLNFNISLANKANIELMSRYNNVGSVKQFYYKDKLYFFYEDNGQRNESNKKERECLCNMPQKDAENCLVMATIDKDGKLMKQGVFNGKDFENFNSNRPEYFVGVLNKFYYYAFNLKNYEGKLGYIEVE